MVRDANKILVMMFPNDVTLDTMEAKGKCIQTTDLEEPYNEFKMTETKETTINRTY